MARDARAQRSITRAEAIQAALARGPRLGVAAADTAAARAQLLTARALPNPVFTGTYSKDVPQFHYLLDLPIDYPWLRGSRVSSANLAQRAAGYRFTYERESIALDADTTYTRALAAMEHARLSHRNAIAADSLRRMAALRREAGDASDLDVELATVFSGQQANLAAADSLELQSALLDLQTVMGTASDRVAVMPTDSLTLPTDGDAGEASAGGTRLQVAAAEASLASTEQAVKLQRRMAFPLPSITAGVEFGDPSGQENGLLPTVGIALPIPIFDRNRGPIAQAEAERQRAQAGLALARLESDAQVARARRARELAMSRAQRDRVLLASADRVATMSLRAYQEGASSLPNVLEAQRTAREILGQYIDDVASARNASAALRLFTLTASNR